MKNKFEIFLLRKPSARLVVACAVLLVLSALIYIVGHVFSRSNKNGTVGLYTNSSTTPSIVTYRSKFDGSIVEKKEEIEPIVVGVMIDNNSDVKNQAGLAEAHVVYEAPVEGGITRYMALFSASSTLRMVGPVRSARSYFLDWIQEYGTALYMHIGGSPEALARLKSVDFLDVNEFWWGKYFWRSAEHVAPHNTFTNSEKWQSLLGDRAALHLFQSWDGWLFDAAANTSSSTLSKLLIPYTSDYKVSWNYDKISQRYVRYVNGDTDLDYQKNTITADNIVIQLVAMKTIDDVGRRSIETVGTGEALVARQGELVRGTWKKNSPLSRTRFYDALGAEVALVPGITWVQVVPKEVLIELTN